MQGWDGVRTPFRYDGEKSEPLSIVIKLRTCAGVPVVKLSDNPEKATGDKDAIRVAKWTFNNEPLDGLEIKMGVMGAMMFNGPSTTGED